MRKHVKIGVLVAAAVVMSSVAVFGIGVPAKLKSKKLGGDLVPAFYPSDSGRNTGDDENDSAAFIDTAVARSSCTFLKGQFKFQTGKDGQVKLGGVVCGGVPFNGNLCAHAKGLSTIANEEIDATGMSTPASCMTGGAGEIGGKLNWVSVNVGVVTCINGTCKGTLPQVAADPCPSVDKITEYRRVEVFDGPDTAVFAVLGTTLKTCCGPGQTIVGGTSVGTIAPCNTSTQDVMAIGGTILQGVLP